jgi:N-acyl-L-homoserine lactone synthetase
MHLTAIAAPQTILEHRRLDEMHKLRARVFQGRLGWDVECSAGREKDQFDLLGPTYILAISDTEDVIGCARLLPATGTTMLQSIFSALLRDGVLSSHTGMIESSRFCVDTDNADGGGERSLHVATLSMFAGIVEWSMLNGYTEIATATDVRFERILARAGWPISRLGDPVLINETRSLAGTLPADLASFERLRPPGYRSSFSRVLWRAS